MNKLFGIFLSLVALVVVLYFSFEVFFMGAGSLWPVLSWVLFAGVAITAGYAVSSRRAYTAGDDTDSLNKATRGSLWALVALALVTHQALEGCFDDPLWYFTVLLGILVTGGAGYRLRRA